MESLEAPETSPRPLRVELLPPPQRPSVSREAVGAKLWPDGPALPRSEPRDGRPWLLRLTVNGRTLLLPEDEVGQVATALRLLRTVFEDHHVDRDHQSCRFFRENTIGSGAIQHDFSVTHRGDAVFLSEYTWDPLAPALSLTQPDYARALIEFGRAVLAATAARSGSDGAMGTSGANRADAAGLRRDMARLLTLAERYLAAGCPRGRKYHRRFYHLQGRRKRALSLRVVTAQLALHSEQADWHLYWDVEAKVEFGPVQRGQLQPMRLGRGPVMLLEVLEFNRRGVRAAVHGAGARALRPGDRLTGLQLFYE